MSRLPPQLTFGVGLLLGLLTSGLLTFGATTIDADAPLMRPETLPEGALWQESVFGAPGWLQCADANGKVACSAYSRSGITLVEAKYVPRDGDPPAQPFEHLVAREVERIWINKIAMVPDGTVEFPADGRSISYRKGVRLGEPPP